MCTTPTQTTAARCSSLQTLTGVEKAGTKLFFSVLSQEIMGLMKTFQNTLYRPVRYCPRGIAVFLSLQSRMWYWLWLPAQDTYSTVLTGQED